jgi:hypothetical protein
MSEQLLTEPNLDNTIFDTTLPLPSKRREPKPKPRFAEFACRTGEVWRFAVLVTEAVIPKPFWGSDTNFKLTMSCAHVIPSLPLLYTPDRFLKIPRRQTVYCSQEIREPHTSCRVAGIQHDGMQLAWRSLQTGYQNTGQRRTQATRAPRGIHLLVLRWLFDSSP